MPLASVLRKLALRIWLLLPSSVRLFTYRRLVDIGIHIYGETSSSRAFRLPFHLYAKYGDNVVASEANVMRFLAENTTIPVPRVIDCIEIPTGVFIVMTRLPGETLKNMYVFMTADERVQFELDLGSSLKQLHSITAPNTCVSAFDGGSFRDWRIDCFDRIGPFDSEREFYDILYRSVQPHHHGRLREIARGVHDRSHRLCLTHNDLNAHNILIDNNRFSGLVDWECTAWLPEWWEYTRSMYKHGRYEEWVKLMNSVHPETYPKELEVEKEIWWVHHPM